MDKMRYRSVLEKIRPYVPGRPIEDVKKEYGLETVYKLASNENPYGCSKSVNEAVIKSLEEPAYYPDGNCTALKAEVSKFLNVKPSQLIFGCGTDEVIAMLGKVFIEPGDNCVTGSVTFSQYEAAVVSMDGEVIYIPMKDHGFDLDKVAESINEKTKIVFVANPNNPTGTVFTAEQQKAFLDKIPSHIPVAIDEAYAEFVVEEGYPDTLSMMKEYKNIILLKTFSKAYGLASFRVGYGVADESIISEMEKIRAPFNVSVQAQAAAIAALKDQAFVKYSAEENKKVTDYFCEELKKMNLTYIPTHTNFIMVDLKKPSKDVFVELMKKGYTIRPGYAFGMDTYIRVSIGTLEQMKGLVAEIKNII